jgi:hypothetical protein
MRAVGKHPMARLVYVRRVQRSTELVARNAKSAFSVFPHWIQG